jgi:hypothetical protein
MSKVINIFTIGMNDDLALEFVDKLFDDPSYASKFNSLAENFQTLLILKFIKEHNA